MNKLGRGAFKGRLLRLILILTLGMLLSCGKAEDPYPGVFKFGVISDPHLYDSSLGLSGEAFDAYLESDVKMLAESEHILKAAVDEIRKEFPPPSFVVMPGDLTKDGEYESHRLMVSYLSLLKDSGIAVYVVPGNHDVQNPEAARYGEQGTIPVLSPGPQVFSDIYMEFGYGEALYRDTESLSYVAEPVPGLWLFVIDTCRYSENMGKAVTGGKIGALTLEWILSLLEKARAMGKTAVGVMHHGIVEHFIGHAEYFPDYILEDWDRVGHELTKAGMKLTFTGHYHTQNITKMIWNDGTSLIEIRNRSRAIVAPI